MNNILLDKIFEQKHLTGKANTYCIYDLHFRRVIRKLSDCLLSDLKLALQGNFSDCFLGKTE